MKYVDTSTLGGRIRLIRQKMDMSLADLGAKIGVSANYVSVIERNAKCPSDDLVDKIADATGVSINWLKTGEDGDHRLGDGNHEIDASLFLNILMMTNPSITKTAIATILAVDDSELDEILSGNTKYDPAWEAGFSALTQRIDDFSGLQEKLCKIQDYLRQEESKKIDFGLIRMFRVYLSKKFQCDFTFINNEHMVDFKGSSPARHRLVVPYRQKHFVCKQEKPESIWHIWSLSWHSRADLKDVLDRIKYNSKKPCENIVLAVDKKRDFEFLLSADWKQSSPWGETSPSRPKFFLMLIDTDAVQVVGDMVEVEI